MFVQINSNFALSKLTKFNLYINFIIKFLFLLKFKFTLRIFLIKNNKEFSSNFKNNKELSF